MYGGALYGTTPLPYSGVWDIFDFCEPTDAAMLLLLGYSGVRPARFGGVYSWFNGANDYVMASADGADSGLRVDVPVPSGTFSLQFTILPTDLPDDFADVEHARVQVGVFNAQGSCCVLFLSEHGGIAISDGTGSPTVLTDSADIFSAGTDYYTFRLTVNELTDVVHLYVTRKDVLAATGVSELRYTFAPFPTPAAEVDNVRIEILGSVADPVEIGLDCLKLSSSEVITDRCPVAVIAADRAHPLTRYAWFDGRASYDPDVPPAELVYCWTVTDAPMASALWTTVEGSSPADASGYTNILTGAVDAFSEVSEGDLLFGELGGSTVMRVATDGSWLALENDVLAASTTASWKMLRQALWGGERLTGTVMTDVLARLDVPPGGPVLGDTYLVVATAVGVWVGHEGELATWDGLAWTFAAPAARQMVFVLAELEAYRTTGPAPAYWYPDDPEPWELDCWEGRTTAVGVALGDTVGLYTVQLVVNDGFYNSTPAYALLNLYENTVPLGLVPDLSFIWNYLSDFWGLVEGKEFAETFWSAAAQLLTDELMRLWQDDYAKSLVDIQRSFQRRWLDYPLRYEEPSYVDLPATITTGYAASGYAATPVPVSVPGDLPVDAPRVYVMDPGTLPAGSVSGLLLVLDGIGYRISQAATDQVIVQDALPTTPSSAWLIDAAVTSRSSDFGLLGVTAGDTAVFEVQLATGETVEVGCHVWGVHGTQLSFDATGLAAYLADDSYQVLFKGVLRRSVIPLDDLVLDLPRLQEVINYRAVSGAPAPLESGHDFRLEPFTTFDGVEVNSVQLLNSYFIEQARGWTGYTDAFNHEFLYDTAVDFEVLFGVGADLTGYVLELDGVRYRLRQVVGANQIELYSSALALSQTGLAWHMRSVEVVPDQLWAEVTYLDNGDKIEAFGRLAGFTLDDWRSRTDELDYRSAVQGLWYYLWHGRTLENTRSASQVILGLPFAEVAGVVADVKSPFDSTRSRVLVQDRDNLTTYRTYYYPTAVGLAINPETDAPYTLGDAVEQFAALSGGVVVTDYVEDPTWIAPYVGSGDLHEPQKVHTWGVLVDSAVFSLVNLLFLIDYLRRYKPQHTDPFFAVIKSLHDDIDVGDPCMVGPVVPFGYTYPDTWEPYNYPVDWASSPHEVPRAPVTFHSPVTVPPVPLVSDTYGGLRLADVPGRVPDGSTWVRLDGTTHSPTRADGTFALNDIDGSGHTTHIVGDSLLAVNELSDGDMENGINPGALLSPWQMVDVGGMGLPIAAVKSALQNHTPGGADSMYVISTGTHTGVEQEIAVGDEGWQIGVRLWVYLVSGQVYVRLLDQDAGQTVLAEWRHAVLPNQWVQVTLHAWELSAAAGNVPTLQILTGPGGGEFYVDDAAVYHKQMPWSQWGLNRSVVGRTGGYTLGGLPDDVPEITVAVPVVGVPTLNSGFVLNAANSPDVQRLAGPAPGPLPPADWTVPGVSTTPWYGPYGLPVDEWKAATGYGVPYGAAPEPTSSWLVGVPLPAGWYTRIVGRRTLQ